MIEVSNLDLDVEVEGGSRFLGKKFSPRAYRADNEVEVDHGTDEGGRPRETTSPRPGFPEHTALALVTFQRSAITGNWYDARVPVSDIVGAASA